MKKTIIVIVVLIVLGAIALGIFNNKRTDSDNFGRDHRNASYIIDGEKIQLIDGKADNDNVVTRVFGNEVEHDFDIDGTEDIAFILVQEVDEDTAVYYAVVALNKEEGYRGSEGFFLGRNIHPQTTEIKDTILVVNYGEELENADSEENGMVQKTKNLSFDVATLQFSEKPILYLDLAKLSLDLKSWTWVETVFNDGRNITPKQPLAFTLEFLSTGEFLATTDCNRMAGKYTTGGNNTISFKDIASTKMYCEGSQEKEFAGMLTNTSSYHFSQDGGLILDLKFDSGSVVFK